LWWQDLDLRDLGAATIRFGFQADRDGERVELKTEESKATLPLPRSAALMLLEHKARTPRRRRRRRTCSARGRADRSDSATSCARSTAPRSARTPDGRRRDGEVVLGLLALGILGGILLVFGAVLLLFNGYVEDVGSEPLRTLPFAIPLLAAGVVASVAAWRIAVR
jgi:hypothetical protein